MIYASAIRHNAQLFLKDTADTRAKMLETERDLGLTESGRRARLAPLQATLAEKFTGYRKSNLGLMQSAEGEALALRTDTVRRAGALKDPARTVALADLAARLRDDELVAIAHAARGAKEPDLALAYALGVASPERVEKMAPAKRDALTEALRTLGAPPAAERAHADYIAARIELQRFEGLMRASDGVASITAAREARIVDLDGTGPRALSDAEVEAAYGRLSLPMDPQPVAMPIMRPEFVIETEEDTPEPVTA